jgi:hypothetical protein
MNINILDQIIDAPTQQTSIHTQYCHVLAQLDRRLRQAIDRQDHSLVTALQAEQRFIQAHRP